MKRRIELAYQKWATTQQRKPLIIWGARQIGKTYSIREWASRNFTHLVEMNFQETPSWKKVFAGDLHPDEVLRNIEISLARPIGRNGQDILFFDEIQECPEALTALKYFNEKAPHIPVIAAGSLLGVRLAGTSFPVGKVEMLHMYPMSFGEFLQAASSSLYEIYANAISSPKSIGAVAHERFWQFFKDYLAIGGLPEVVSEWIGAGARAGGIRAFNAARSKSQVLLAGYIADISKHSGKTNSMHIERVWRNVPLQLASHTDGSTQRFKFKDIIPGLKAYRELVRPIDWLTNAGLIIRRPICHSSGAPLAAYTKENIFKLQMFDVGMLGTMTGLSLKGIDAFDFGTYKGYLAENFVAEELCSSYPLRTAMPALHAWNEGQAEIEFLLESDAGPVPVEVKSGGRVRAKSLRSYCERWNPELSVIISAREYSEIQVGAQRQVNLPLYLTERLWKELALPEND